jgi:hypothetical protein
MVVWLILLPLNVGKTVNERKRTSTAYMPPEMACYELYLRSKERQTDSNTEDGKKTMQAAIAEKKKQMKDAASKEDFLLASTCVRVCVSGSVLV